MHGTGKLCSTDAQVASLVSRLERCELELHEFTHAAHLTVAVAYLLEAGESGALDRMRASLRRFSAYHGKMGYHETITRFWVSLLAGYLADQGPLPTSELAAGAVREFGDKALIFTYYSRERLMSAEARLAWVRPDLRNLSSRDMQAPERVADDLARGGGEELPS